MSVPYPSWRIEPVGDRCLMVAFPDRVEADINQAVHALAARLLARLPEGVTDLVPAFSTLGVHYRPDVRPGAQPVHQRLQSVLESLLAEGRPPALGPSRQIEIPVCYGGEFGPDLDEVASACGLSPDEVVRRHGASDHVVCMLGFAPGFPYLGGLDPSLAMPRRASPRVRIAPGTVAIAREQSAIYTLETPGGWNLIGRTAVALFTPQSDPPTLLQPGDRVRFRAVSAEALAQAQARVLA
ncbi:MAG: 5-oxoprolinase subunit PxpB [Burkholderiales bacterium]